MGLMDFFRKGKETPASTQATNPQPGSRVGPPAQNTPVTGASAPEPKTQRDYVIQSGDSLSKIAKRFYGNATDWQKIYQANRDKIKDPNLIYPGQKIIIP
jgi:nucleoid-associated protein YgaU